MNTSINFVLPKGQEFLEQQKRAKTINLIATSFPIMVGIISLILFLITQAINPVSIKEQQEETINKIAKLQDRKIKLFIVNDRLDNISELLKGRRNFADNISTLLSRMPSQVSLENLEIDDKQILITASSVSLRSIDEFINNLIVMAEEKEVIHSLFLDSLTFEEGKNNYLVSLKSEL